MRETSTYYILDDDEYPFPSNNQRLQYLDQPWLTIIPYKDAVYHQKAQEKRREKRKHIVNALQSNCDEREA